MNKIKNKVIIIRNDLKQYFEVIESTENGTKGLIKCLHKDCQESKPRSYNAKQGWSSHQLHLESQHGISKSKADNDKTGNSPLLSFIVKKKKLQKYSNSGCYSFSNMKQIEFMTNLMDLVCVGGVPLNLIEHPVMMKFIRDLDKSIRLPSRSTLTNHISLEAKRIVAKNKYRLKNVSVGSLHLSFDLWTSRSHKLIMGIRAHHIDEDWKLNSFSLAFLEYTFNKQASFIRKAFLEQIGSRYLIKPDQVGILMTDNARENVQAFGDPDIFNNNNYDDDEDEPTQENTSEVTEIDWEDVSDENFYDDMSNAEDSNVEDDEIYDTVDKWAGTNLIRLGCMSHGLQLVIKECLKKNPNSNSIQLQVEKLVSFFNKSTFWNSKLITKTRKGLIKIGDTRWNGFLLALNRLLEVDFLQNLNSVLEEAHVQNGKKNNVPELISLKTQIEMLELSQLLNPFYVLTQELQAEGVTSSLVILGVITLYKRVAAVDCTVDYMKALKSSLCLTLTERFGSKEQFYYAGRGSKKNMYRIFDNEAYILATILDPRWKMEPFSTLNPGPKFGEPIPNVTVAVGRDASLPCVVENLGNHKVAWVHIDRRMILTIHKHIVTRIPRFSVSYDSHKTWLLHVNSVQQEDRGYYMCQVNTEPMISQVGYLQVVVPPNICDDDSSESHVAIREQANITLSCKAEGFPEPRITWKREDGQPFSIDKRRKVNASDGERLQLYKISRLEMGAYLCIASNGVPPSVSKRIIVDVEFQPMIWVPNQLVGSPAGTNVTLECNTEAFPRAISYWVYDDMMILTTGKYNTETVESSYRTHMRLTIRNLREKDFGRYRCLSKNSLGEAEGAIRLYEIPQPSMPPKATEVRTNKENPVNVVRLTPIPKTDDKRPKASKADSMGKSKVDQGRNNGFGGHQSVNTGDNGIHVPSIESASATAGSSVRHLAGTFYLKAAILSATTSLLSWRLEVWVTL